MIRYLIILSLLIFSCSNISNNNHLNMNNENNISLKDKIAQMIMVRTDGKYYNGSHWKEQSLNSLIDKYNVGGLITYSGSVHGTYYKLNSYQERSKIPLFVAADYERGLGTFMDGTLFPPNMALAATNNTNYSYEQGRIIAAESKKIGVNIILAPVLDINNNPNNPIINIRSYGDTPEKVAEYAIPFIKGIQDGGLIACAKHYPGHGNTGVDSHTSLPTINISKEQLFNHELRPFKKACESGVGSVMIGHILIPSMDKKNPATFSKIITEDILRRQWNYNGLIITDALEMGALTSTTWHGESAIKSIEGGADIILLPLDAISAIDAIYNAVKTGRISEDRIDYSYRKIINKKNEIGLYENNSTNWNELSKTIATSNHLGVAKKIAKESITLVKNEKSLLPFSSKKYNKVTHILLSTDNDLRKRMKTYAYNIKYTHGNVKEIYVNDPLSDLAIEDILNKVDGSSIVIISMLIRISMNKGLATIHDTHQELLNKMSLKNIPMIGLSFGSPYLSDYSVFDSYVCGYGYGKVSFDAAFEAIFGREKISGKLPITLNDKYKIGHGIEVKKNEKIFINKNINLNAPLKIIKEAISDSIFPGAQIFVSKEDEIIINEGFGNFTYDKKSKIVTNESIYDVASLTKVLATTPIIMKLVQQKKIGLNYPLSDFYPQLKNDMNKKDITIKHLLTHTAGFKAHENYSVKKDFISRTEIVHNILSMDLIYAPGKKTVYSDLGIILLLDIIERITSSDIDKLSQKYFFKPFGMTHTLFNPDSLIRNNIVPTEKDDYFRHRLIHGEVHDENAFILGGVSTHAGLFSNAYDIGIFSKMLLNKGLFLGRRYLKNDIINKFTKRVNTPINSDRAIGFDTPSRDGKSSAGDYFSNEAYGHLGFTGTSLWIDPKKELIVVLLTNRIHPKRGNKTEMYNLRRNFHNALMIAIEE